MSDLVITNLTKTFKDVTALDSVSIDAKEGELLTLLGPSGCGKSTTLWSIAGLHQPDSGSITVGGRTFFDGRKINLRPEQRDCGVVFQSYAVWPHMTVRDNVGYPLKMHRTERSSRGARVDEVLELVEMSDYADRYPHELSGGQQQRVALARALSFPPRLLLLDEPFSNLDAKLRDRAREWLKRLQQSIGVTTVFVTHDQEEALSMSDRIVVMSNGRVHQIGTPEDVYHAPTDRFVADFIGTTNLVEIATLESSSHGSTVRLDGTDLVLESATPSTKGRHTVSIRPESIELVDDTGPEGPGELRVKVVERAFLGDHYRYWLQLQGVTLIAQSQIRTDASELLARVRPEAVRVLPHCGAETSGSDDDNH